MGTGRFNWLINPFENLTDKKLIIIGSISFCILIYLSYLWNFISIGLFHLQPITTPKTLLITFVNNSVNLLVLTLLFYGIGKLVNRKTRLLDIFIVVLVAQVVFLFVVIPLCNPYMIGISEEIGESLKKGDITLELISNGKLTVLTIGALVSLVALVYYCYLVVIGLRIAVNSKKKYHGLVIVLLLFAVDIFLSLFKPYW